jgi:putative transposase
VPRALRIQAPGLHHVSTRGNNGAPIYLDDDRKLFVAILHRTSVLRDWRLHLWCLMTIHFHLLIETRTENLAQGMHSINSRHAHAVNERHRRSGHLFERRYSSRLIESEAQYRNTALYIVHNPVVAELCEDPRDWPWADAGGSARRPIASRRSRTWRFEPGPVPGTGRGGSSRGRGGSRWTRGRRNAGQRV